MQPTHRQQALFFHKVLTAGIGIFLVVSVITVLWFRPTWSLVPIWTMALLLAVSGASLLVGMWTRFSDRTYDWAVVFLTFLTSLIAALSYPQV
mmetsp:Transcript_64384/g.129333  ORF Transcript_64384/g.129333 Transcript_64384/m.129333 type:complete len:93 (-) Transcript_64384:736-1014(-)